MREKYESLALQQLKELAKVRGLKGTSTMKKSELVENTVGRFNLTKGKHIIRIEFVDGFYFDWFEFYKDGKKIGNSIRADKMAGEPNPSFDDGLGNIR